MAEPAPSPTPDPRPLRPAAARSGPVAGKRESRREEMVALAKQVLELRMELAEAEAQPEPVPAPAPEPARPAARTATGRERGSHRFPTRQQTEPALRDPSAPGPFRAWDEPLPEPPPTFVRRIPRPILYTVILLIVSQCFAAGYYVSRVVSTRPPEEPERTSPREWSDEYARDLQRVFEHFAADRNTEGRQAAAALLAKGPELPGIALLEAQAARSEGRLATLDFTLFKEQQQRGPFSYRAALERARGFAAQRKPVDSANALREAIELDPVRPEAHFQLGELFRRTGRFSEAVGAYDQAAVTVRTGYQPDAALIRLRRQLALLESGREGTLAAECAAALALPNPTPEWLALDAAIKLLAGNLPASRAALSRLKANCPPARLATLVDDHLFRGLLNRAELRDILPRADRNSVAGSFFPPS